ncbi:MAG: RagB/SusD family nutrient uptake outer membrane protein [Muribaculaceae bacterium]|nr:RagB/SusD family nutrient uptake outer membrane protein [Muribaculaceae bacterium]
MNIIKKSILWSVMAAAGLSMTSCDSFLKEFSQDLAKVTSWEDLDEVLLGDAYVASCRLTLDDDDDEAGQNWDILHVMTDELKLMPAYSTDVLDYEANMFAFITWQQDTGIDKLFKYVGKDESYFNDLYRRINVCNMVLALIDEQPAPHREDELAKERVKGEAYYLRGVYYFMLANLYCPPYNPATASKEMGMPLKFTEYIEDTEYTRASLEDTYKTIIDDLKNAVELLKGKSRKSIYHANSIAAELLLSRIYLYMQDWTNAALYAQSVIDQQPDLLDLRSIQSGQNSVSASSPETIFSMGDYAVSALTADNRGSLESSFPQWLISDEMMAMYASNDLRNGRYVGQTQIRRERGAFLKVDGQRRAWGPMYDVGSVFLMRTPEAYLTLAEASAYSGDNGKAQEILAQFLKYRMSGSTSVNKTGNDLIEFIRDERAREFLLEGHRWFDLRRYTVNQVYPWSKEIVHAYPYDADYNFSYYDYYRLEKNDPAYTLPLPRSVRNFQISLGSVERPVRVKIEAPEED